MRQEEAWVAAAVVGFVAGFCLRWVYKKRKATKPTKATTYEFWDPVTKRWEGRCDRPIEMDAVELAAVRGAVLAQVGDLQVELHLPSISGPPGELERKVVPLSVLLKRYSAFFYRLAEFVQTKRMFSATTLSIVMQQAVARFAARSNPMEIKWIFDYLVDGCICDARTCHEAMRWGVPALMPSSSSTRLRPMGWREWRMLCTEASAYRCAFGKPHPFLDVPEIALDAAVFLQVNSGIYLVPGLYSHQYRISHAARRSRVGDRIHVSVEEIRTKLMELVGEPLFAWIESRKNTMLVGSIVLAAFDQSVVHSEGDVSIPNADADDKQLQARLWDRADITCFIDTPRKASITVLRDAYAAFGESTVAWRQAEPNPTRFFSGRCHRIETWVRQWPLRPIRFICVDGRKCGALPFQWSTHCEFDVDGLAWQSNKLFATPRTWHAVLSTHNILRSHDMDRSVVEELVHLSVARGYDVSADVKIVDVDVVVRDDEANPSRDRFVERHPLGFWPRENLWPFWKSTPSWTVEDRIAFAAEKEKLKS